MSAPLGQPSSLEAALVRIRFLEGQLALAQQVVRQRCGEDLSALLDAAGRGVAMAPPNKAFSPPTAASDSALSAPSAPPAASSAPTSFQAPADEATDTAAEDQDKTVDVGPFVLRAIQLRKDLHVGRVDEKDGEKELQRILDGAEGLSEEQRGTVRSWAGL
ncbi:hypothetical protein JCM10207_004457 [Rhodosporidiobolus poonsookiae]